MQALQDGEDPRALAAAAMRRLNHAMVAHDADDGLLRRITAQAHATADVIEGQARRHRPIALLKQQMWESPPPDGAAMQHFAECIVSGAHNPMGIGMTPRRVGDRVEATVHLGPAYEAAPQRAHGGIVAAILDDIMGYVLLVQRTPAFTGHLGVAYRAPTPVGSDRRGAGHARRHRDRRGHGPVHRDPARAAGRRGDRRGDRLTAQ
jgi:hypothetical protein